MKLLRAKELISLFCIICLLFTYQHSVQAKESESQLPELLNELLTGKTSAFSFVAAQLPETDLPAALAAVELLKFKALHQEIPLTVEQVSKFETLIKSRLQNSFIVSFSKTQSCVKKVEAKEIEIAGQKFLVPEFYIADTGLAITGLLPAGEAGTIFPDLSVNVYSQSALTEYGLTIDGKEAQNHKISLVKNDDELVLVFRPELNAESVLAIGTHTAGIFVANEAGEKTKKSWSFTVGVYDVSTLPLPKDAVAINEIAIDPQLIDQKSSSNLLAIIYQDKTGKRYMRYRLIKPSGVSVESGNLAFIVRKMNSRNDFRYDLTILPRISMALEGHSTTFSYELNEPGDITKVEWEINGVSYPSPSYTFHGNTRVNCRITAFLKL
jgi:hypothetical protein